MFDVVVVGGGRLGLPLSVLLSRRGFRVLVVDIDSSLVENVNEGINPYPDEEGMDVLGRLVEEKRLLATTSYDDIPFEPRAVFITISNIFDGIKIDSSNVYEAVSMVAERVKRDTPIIIKTVVPIGTTRKIYEQLTDKGLRPALAFSAERGREGTMISDLDKYPVIYGVADPRDEAGVGRVFRGLGWKRVVSVGSSDAAEFAKYASNTILALMITYSNILAEYAERLGIDVWRVIEALNYNGTHIPKIWRPGHYGGYCLTKDPSEFAYRAAELRLRDAHLFLSTIPILQRRFVEYEVAVIEDVLGGVNGKKILVLGKSFKPRTADTRYSPAVLLAELLRRRGAHVEQYDPYTDPPGQEPPLHRRDAVVVATAHPEFADTEYYDYADVVIDLFNIVKEKKGRKIYVLAGKRLLGDRGGHDSS